MKGKPLVVQKSSLQIEPLEAEQFDQWKSNLKDRWVQLRCQSGKVTSKEAMATVTRIIERRFPEGLSTVGQFVMNISESGVDQGSFWLEIEGTRGFLYDVAPNGSVNAEDVRNLIEEEAITRGASELRVNVFSGDQFLKTLTASDKFATISTQMWLLDNPANNQLELNHALVLRPMRPEEFPEYFQEQIDIYAAEKVAAGKCTLDEALLESKEEMAKLLPDGLLSKDQFIFVAELENRRIGTAWVDIDNELEVPRAFGLYIEIDNALRGQGLGRDLMKAIQAESRKLGAKGFALSVFGHNLIARKMYESFGFKVTEEMKQMVLVE